MINMMFKIKYGYQPCEYVTVDNLDMLAKAWLAKIEKLPIVIGGKMLSGQEIKSIEPDINHYTGWNMGYHPTHCDDFNQIERDVPKVLYELVELTGKRVADMVDKGNDNLIGKEGLTPEMLKLASGDK